MLVCTCCECTDLSCTPKGLNLSHKVNKSSMHTGFQVYYTDYNFLSVILIVPPRSIKNLPSPSLIVLVQLHSYVYMYTFFTYPTGIPKFTVTPRNSSTITSGGSVTLMCSAFAVPEPVISWTRSTYYGTEEIVNSSNIMYNGNTLFISNMQYYDDDGNYSCIATNSRGTSYASARVKIHGKITNRNYVNS